MGMYGNRWLVLLVSFLLMAGCYEKQEGCLDADASNIDFSADEACCCCCAFPKLTFNLNHLYDSLSFQLDAVYSTTRAQPFIVKHLSWYVSEIQLVKDSEMFRVSDQVDVEGLGGLIAEQPDDVTILDRAAFQFDIGTFKAFGTFTSVMFDIGLSDLEIAADPTSFDVDHPLSSSGNDLWSSKDGYRLYQIGIIRDTSSMVIDTFFISADLRSTISLDLDLTTSRGSNLSLPLNVDYAVWFREIDMIADDQDIISAKIREGISKSFSINK